MKTFELFGSLYSGQFAFKNAGLVGPLGSEDTKVTDQICYLPMYDLGTVFISGISNKMYVVSYITL